MNQISPDEQLRSNQKIVSRLNDLAVKRDCIGGIAAKPFQSYYSPKLDMATGNYQNEYRSANETGCKAMQSCNLKTYPVAINKVSCNPKKYEGVCFSFSKKFGYQITKLPTCKLKYDEDIPFYCEKYKGTLSPNGDCYLPKTTLQACLDGLSPIESDVNEGIFHSKRYCYNPTMTKTLCAKKGNWNPTVQKCIVQITELTRKNCLDQKLEYVPSFEFTEGAFMTKESCQGKACSVGTDTSRNQKISREECLKLKLATPAFCNDFEHPNGGGLCTSIPTKSNLECERTRSGRCIIGRNETKCEKQWSPKAYKQEFCEKKDFYCQYEDGRPNSFLNYDNCTACGGNREAVYKWVVPRAETGFMRSLNWTKVKWQSDFELKSHVMTISLLESIVLTSITKVQAYRTLRDYRHYWNTYLTVFNTVNCACGGKNTNCFDGEIVTGLGSCDLDDGSPFKCENLFARQLHASYRNIPVVSFSMVNLVGNNDTAMISHRSNRPLPLALVTYFERTQGKELRRKKAEKFTAINNLQKRCNPVSVYEIIYSESHGTSGQIIGNGMRFFITNPPDTPIKLCLTIDLSVPTNQQKYTHIDIAIVYSKLTRWFNQIYPLYTADAYFDGLKVCATVQIWPEIVYMPILRI